MAKSAKNDRRAVIEQMRKQQQNSERRRTLLIVGACVAVGVLLLGIAAYRPVTEYLAQREFSGQDVADIGAPAEVCGEVTTAPATGQQQHLPPGSPIDYPTSPPAFGEHYDSTEPMSRKFYASGDRPEVGFLVHNLEHGYTVVWYDETVAGDTDQVAALKAIADNFPGTSDLRNKFKAVPWTEEDGAPFPDGMHVALTHWSAGAGAEGGKGESVGVTQYCSEPSGQAVESFVSEYPYLDSLEPNGA